ncbi:GTPase [Schaalia sp. Marseille-Q2122]|uniref:GTPase n=1 Tax=Schaalia sp. Marseille-Q2122 TaxID=2736604 RepID=UPI0020CA6FCB|nr:GTPase [Schaalia sp. Marseille-Q2122]
MLDAPDVDSVVDENRALARQMLDAADLWVFVTTAARYADAVPWSVLAPAAARGVLVAIVLNRVPPGAGEQVAADLARLMGAQGLGRAPLFVIEEHALEDARLSDSDIAPVREWLESQSADAQTRAEVAQRAVAASVAQVIHSAQEVRAAQEAEAALRERSRQLVDHAVDAALLRLADSTADGTLLRGEVVARWQEIVGAADFTRSLTRTVATVRDRITSYLTGKPAPVAPVEDALEAGLSTLIEDELMRLREDAEGAWRADQWLSRLLPVAVAAPNARELAVDVTHRWQAELLEIVRTQGASKRTGARIMAIGVNVVAVALMIVIFASTGGITGMELGVAGASAAVSQKLLEAIFGDQAVRTMTKRAQELLREHLAQAAEAMVAGLRAACEDNAPELVAADGEGQPVTVEDALKEVMQ